jgi:cell wall-associated NlpC family hydrolase
MQSIAHGPWGSLTAAAVVGALVVVVPVLGPPGRGPQQTAVAATYLQPVARITPATGCWALSPGFTGVKVKRVQRKFGVPNSAVEQMTPALNAKVRAFQLAHGLRATGVVDATTWSRMGFRESFCMDRWQPSPPPLSATSAQRIETMINFALGYRGAEYVWGGAGTRRYGVDCSGLVLQALHRAGLDPRPVTIDAHVHPGYRTAAALYGHPGIRKVPRARARRGDLIFYTSNSTHRIIHVAIYLGGGVMMNAVEPTARGSAYTRTRPGETVAPYVQRPFA